MITFDQSQILQLKQNKKTDLRLHLPQDKRNIIVFMISEVFRSQILLKKLQDGQDHLWHSMAI